MSGISGYEAAAALRKSGFTKPIVAFTANVLPQDRELSLKSGCNAHITKPVDQRELIKTLFELISSS